MHSNDEEILNGRFEASTAEIADFTDKKLRTVNLESWRGYLDHAPYPHLPLEIYTQEKGEDPTSSTEIETTITSIIGGPHLGQIFLHMYWYDNIYRIDGWIHMRNDSVPDYFKVGEIKLVEPNPERGRPTNVIVTSDWAAMRPFMEWVTRRLKRKFKLLRKGGPKSTPLARKLKIVQGWYQVEGTLAKEIYCGNNGISLSGFRKWEKELRNKGLITHS